MKEEQQYQLEDGLVPSGFEACRDCENLRVWRESRGEFWGAPCSEEMAECIVNGEPEECPYWPWNEDAKLRYQQMKNSLPEEGWFESEEEE